LAFTSDPSAQNKKQKNKFMIIKKKPIRAELDKIVFDVLGLTDDERKEVYCAVCQLVWNRISKARSV